MQFKCGRASVVSGYEGDKSERSLEEVVDCTILREALTQEKLPSYIFVIAWRA